MTGVELLPKRGQQSSSVRHPHYRDSLSELISQLPPPFTDINGPEAPGLPHRSRPFTGCSAWRSWTETLHSGFSSPMVLWQSPAARHTSSHQAH